MSIAQQIESIVSSMTDNNIPPKLVTIVKGYDKAICDIQTDNGILKNIQCSTLTTAGNKGLLVYNNGEENKPFVIVFKESKNSDLIDLIYPVGSIYMSVNNTSPSILFGGTWEQIEDTFLLSSGTTYSNGDTGGEATHRLTSAESGQKDLGTVTSTGGNHYHTLDSNYRYLVNTADGSGVSRTSTAGQTGTKVSNLLQSPNAVNRHAGVASGNLSVSTTISGSDASNAHNNMPPYLTVNMWKRTG